MVAANITCVKSQCTSGVAKIQVAVLTATIYDSHCIVHMLLLQAYLARSTRFMLLFSGSPSCGTSSPPFGIQESNTALLCSPRTSSLEYPHHIPRSQTQEQEDWQIHLAHLGIRTFSRRCLTHIRLVIMTDARNTSHSPSIAIIRA